MKEVAGKIAFFAAAATAFLFPLFQLIIPWLIFLLTLCWLVRGNFAKNWRTHSSSTRQAARLIAIPFLIFYLLYVIGFTYSDNVQSALQSLEVKLSFLVLPLVFFTGSRFSQRQVRTILAALVAGCGVACAIIYGIAIDSYLQQPSSHWFYSSYLSLLMHRGYFSLYLLFASIVLVYYVLMYWQNVSLMKKLASGAILLLFSITIILLASKIAILLLLVMLLVMGLYLMRRQPVIAVFLFISLGVVIMTGIAANPLIYDRFEVAFERLADGHPKDEVESTSLRMISWKASKDVIGGNFWSGTGTGDFGYALDEWYQSNGYRSATALSLNAHNQFLESAGGLGILGFVAAVAVFVFPFWFSIKRKYFLAASLVGLFFVAAMAESIFGVQAGVVFYVFFCSLLTSTPKADVAQ